MPYHVLLFLSMLMGLSACSHSIPPGQRAETIAAIDEKAEQSLAHLVGEGLIEEQELEQAFGYFAAEVNAAQAPIIGAGKGYGRLYDRQNVTNTYMNIEHFDLGLGLGATRYRLLAIFNEQDALEQFKTGSWVPTVSAGFNLGESGAAVSSSIQDSAGGVDTYYMADSGAALTSSARLQKVSYNHDLNASAVSDISLPIKATRSNSSGDTRYKVWDRALPFFAQDVIDKGYDLPLPYGVSLIYADVFQEMNLTDLEIGFQGSDKVAIDFVSFSDSSSHNQAPQLKVDAWLFPFMNVFATLGRVEGEAKLTIDLEGNGLLGGLEELGKVDCSSIPKPLVCRALEDRDISVPIAVDFHGISYGLGTVLAGGWNNYFVAIPLSFTYADMSNSDTEGIVYNAAPRVGYLFELERYGTLAPYIGASYLHSALTITGTHYFSQIDGLESVDYKIKQENKDKWMALVGLNYDVNKYWSITAEYGGMVGSREQFIASFNRHF